jgi:pyruvate/2-oxoglutarate dehydrogenase complex dihydrolipoamide dehydrogenase (E3) component
MYMFIYIQTYMTVAGTKILTGVLPQSVVKTATGQFLVKFSTGEEELFDTVVAAVGRYADTPGLNLEATGVKTNLKNGKIICVNEQTNISNIYGIGDVVQGIFLCMYTFIYTCILMCTCMYIYM